MSFPNAVWLIQPIRGRFTDSAGDSMTLRMPVFVIMLTPNTNLLDPELAVLTLASRKR